MISVQVEAPGLEQTATELLHAREQIMERWDATLRTQSYRAVDIIKTRYRSGASTTPTMTRVGTGTLRASYGHKVERSASELISTIGLAAFSAKGKALVYGAVPVMAWARRTARG